MAPEWQMYDKRPDLVQQCTDAPKWVYVIQMTVINAWKTRSK
jgi:hypothetical protein